MSNGPDSAHECEKLTYDTNASIYLKDEMAALVISPESMTVFLPEMDDAVDVPAYVLLLTAIAALLARDDFVSAVLTMFDEPIEGEENG